LKKRRSSEITLVNITNTTTTTTRNSFRLKINMRGKAACLPSGTQDGRTNYTIYPSVS